MKIEASYTITAADLERRSIVGRLVPFGVIGNTSAGPTRFAAGSVALPEPLDRVKLLRDHQADAPLGYLEEAWQDETGLYGRFRVPETPAGDLALLEAAEKLRDGLSVGVDLVDYEHSAEALEVAASRLREVSQVSLPAFDDARALAVAASENSEVTEPQPQPEPETEQEPEPMETPEPVEAAKELDLVAAAPIPHTSRPAARSLDLSGVASLIASANKGDLSVAEVRAALSQSTTGDLAGIVPPAYVGEIVGLINPGRPTINAISNRALPASGMKVTYPAWDSKPGVDEQENELDEVTSDAASITLEEVSVRTFAGANELSIQAVDRSDPSAVAAILEALSVSFGQKTNAAAVSGLITAAGAATSVATSSPVDIVSGLIGALDFSATPPGPLFLAIAPDLLPAWISLADSDRPAFWDGRVQFGSMTPTMSADGLTVYLERDLPAGHALLGSSLGATWWERAGQPVEIRAVDVSILGIDLGVYGYGALSVGYPGAFAYCDLS